MWVRQSIGLDRFDLPIVFNARQGMNHVDDWIDSVMFTAPTLICHPHAGPAARPATSALGAQLSDGGSA